MIRDIENKSKKELIEMLEIAQHEYRELKGFFTPKLMESYIAKVDSALNALIEGGYEDIPDSIKTEEDFIAWMTA